MARIADDTDHAGSAGGRGGQPWTQQYYDNHASAAIKLFAAEGDSAHAYLVTESVPMPLPQTDRGRPARVLRCGDDDELADRMRRMVASTEAFGASTNVDTVPTARYVFRSPFGAPGRR